MDVPVLMNLGPAHGEAQRRKKWLKDVLPRGTTFDFEHGAADYRQYNGLARLLVGRNTNAKLFVATCWPTLEALSSWTLKPIVVAGLVDSGQNYPNEVYGIRGFDSAVLCPYWPALIKAVGGAGVTKIAVIYDQSNHPGTLREWQIIDQAVRTGAMCSSIELFKLRAEDKDGQSPTNPSIRQDINDWLAGVGNNPAGLIVTAGTRTTMLRDDIVATVKQRNQTAYKLFGIYASSLFVKHASDGRIVTPDGALMTYGPNLEKLYKKVATDYIKPILGGHPPTPKLVTNDAFELFISTSAAAQVGYTIPAQLNFTLCDGNAKTLMTNSTA